MKHRNIVTVIILSLITLGIYDLYWLASTKKELNARTRVHVPTLWLLFSPILLFLPMIIILLATRGIDQSVTTIISIVLGIVVVIGVTVVPVYWFLKYSKAVSEYTNGTIETAIAFLLLWLLRFVGIAVIQDKFNNMVAAGGASAVVGVPAFAASTPTPAVSAVAQQLANPAPQFQSPVKPVNPSVPQQPSQPVPPNDPQAPLIQ
jgi:membrane protease YdiL (CAAX protease family)